MNKLNIDFLNKILEYDTICIFSHLSPDGDAYGSQSALKEFITTNFSKKVYILGSGFSKALEYFGQMDIVDDEIIKNSLAILVDCSDLQRVEDQRICLSKEIIKMDHHLGSDVQTYPTINISNTTCCSTCQMVGEFILDNSYSISKEVGERLFLGMVTDTGRFQYLASSKNTFIVLDKIIASNIDFQKIYDFLYETNEIISRAKGYISYSFSSYKSVAYIILNKEKLHELNIDFNTASNMVNCLSMMKEYPIWASFCESDEGIIRVELRSKKYNVQKVALLFNGGGHLNASGCRLNSLDKCMDVIKELQKLDEE